MKWYKKQLDQIKKAAGKEDKSTSAKSMGSNSFSFNKTRDDQKNFRDPVASSKRTRKKTDLP